MENGLKHVISDTKEGILEYYKRVVLGMGSCAEIKPHLIKDQLVLAEKDLDNSMFVELLEWAVKTISYWADKIKVWFSQFFGDGGVIAIAC